MAAFLDFGGGGGGRDRKDKLILAVVGVVVVGSVALLLASVFSDGKSKEPPWIVRFKCLNENCGYEWKPDAAKLKAYPEMLLANYARCPKCNGNTGVQMTQCPNCKRFFVSERRKHPDAPATAEMMKVICPYCNTDLIRWQREHPRKK